MAASITVSPVSRRIGVLAFEGVELLDVVGPAEAFSTAAAASRLLPPPYRVEILAPRTGPVRASSGLCLTAEAGLDAALDGGLDTLLIAGGLGVEALCREPAMLDWLRAASARVRRLGAVCTGALLLAEAGLLDGRRAVTHWKWCERLATRYPRVRVEADAVFLCDKGVWTSAGVTAGMDLALAMVEADHGPALALAAARELVMYLRRPGGQSQFSLELESQATRAGPIRRAQEWLLTHLAEPLSVAALADRAAMSPRHFSRRFRAEAGCTPAEFIERARLERARRLLETTPWPLARVASHCGYRSADVLRRAFLRCLGVTPQAYRERFGTPIPGALNHD